LFRFSVEGVFSSLAEPLRDLIAWLVVVVVVVVVGFCLTGWVCFFSC
jgi:hypothetical protein